MKVWLIFSIITLTFISVIQSGSNEDSSSSDEDSNLINITSINLKYLNSEYVNTKTSKASLKRKTNTYTALPIQWDVVKDFPEDVVLITKLERRKSEQEPWVRIETFQSKICNSKDPYHKYLPPFLIELTKGGKCIKKGNYHFDDAGQFQFDKIYQPSLIEGYYFNAQNEIRVNNYQTLIKDFDIQSKSVTAK